MDIKRKCNFVFNLVSTYVSKIVVFCIMKKLIEKGNVFLCLTSIALFCTMKNWISKGNAILFLTLFQHAFQKMLPLVQGKN